MEEVTVSAKHQDLVAVVGGDTLLAREIRDLLSGASQPPPVPLLSAAGDGAARASDRASGGHRAGDAAAAAGQNRADPPFDRARLRTGERARPARPGRAAKTNRGGSVLSEDAEGGLRRAARLQSAGPLRGGGAGGAGADRAAAGTASGVAAGRASGHSDAVVAADPGAGISRAQLFGVDRISTESRRPRDLGGAGRLRNRRASG